MRRHFRAVYTLAAGICAVLAISAWDHLLAPAESPIGRPRVSVEVRTGPAADRDKAGAALAERNPFCSTCTGEQPPPPGQPVARSALPLDLIATHVARRDDRSFATIRDRDTHRVGAYRVGEPVAGSGVVEAIRGGYVLIHNRATDSAERIDLDGRTPAPPAAAPPAREPDDGVVALGDGHYAVDRALIDGLIANPGKIRGVRIRPTSDGVKLSAIRRESLFGRAGLRNGDVLVEANGVDLTSADAMLEGLTRLMTAREVSVTVKRRGQEVTLRYSVR